MHVPMAVTLACKQSVCPVLCLVCAPLRPQISVLSGHDRPRGWSFGKLSPTMEAMQV